MKFDVVPGISVNCPNCGISIIPADGKMMMIGKEDIVLHACGYDISDLIRTVVGARLVEINPIFGIGEMEPLISNSFGGNILGRRKGNDHAENDKVSQTTHRAWHT